MLCRKLMPLAYCNSVISTFTGIDWDGILGEGNELMYTYLRYLRVSLEGVIGTVK